MLACGAGGRSADYVDGRENGKRPHRSTSKLFKGHALGAGALPAGTNPFNALCLGIFDRLHRPEIPSCHRERELGTPLSSEIFAG